MKRIALFCFAVAVVAVTASCGDAKGCDFRDGSLNGPEDRCQERAGLQGIGFGPACQTSGGEELDEPCPDEGKVSGCDLGQGVTDWYYEPMPLEEAQGNCGASEPVVDA